MNLESDHIVVRRHDIEGVAETLPVKDVERVVVVGSPAITFPVLARFMDRGIPCAFLTKGQRWRGALDVGSQRNVARRMLQYDKLREPETCLMLAKGAVAAKLRNCRRVIQRLCANRGMAIPEADEHWRGLNGSIADVPVASDLDAVRGAEGIGSFHYFRLLDGFMPYGFNFPARSRRPPLDPANALLSFAYTVLMNEVMAAVRVHALDVGLGFMHQDRERSPSLALDLMEAFRPGFADLLVLDMVGHDRLLPRRILIVSRRPEASIWPPRRVVGFSPHARRRCRVRSSRWGNWSARRCAWPSTRRFWSLSGSWKTARSRSSSVLPRGGPSC